MAAMSEQKNDAYLKVSPGITAAMYLDYCTGLSVEEVAQKWGYRSVYTVYRRFALLGLPLRTRSRENCKCQRNPHTVTGTAFAEANRERTRIAAQAMCDRAKAAISTTASPHARAILQLRVDHPAATISELAALHDPPVSKHAVASVLRRARVAS